MKAVVIDRMEITRVRAVDYNYPQYQYVYNDSTYINSDRSAHAKGLDVGDSTTIIFNKNNPDEAIIYNFFRYWIPLPYLIIGVLIASFIYFVVINIADYIDFRNDPKYDD